MNSRMDKYEVDTPELKKRTERNKELYHTYEIDNYDKFDINSNISVLKNNAREIDVNQIRDMLDKKYRDNIPQRKSIDIPKIEEPTYDNQIDTKEYDLNSFLSKAKDAKKIDYDVERLNNSSNNLDLIDKINAKYKNQEKEETDSEHELKELINTITALELKNQKKDADLLGLSDDDESLSKTSTSIIPESALDEEFYTGKLAVKEEDFDDFKDMQDDIKSNSIFIKILVFIFIIILLITAVYVVDKIFDLGLFFF